MAECSNLCERERLLHCATLKSIGRKTRGSLELHSQIHIYRELINDGDIHKHSNTYCALFWTALKEQKWQSFISRDKDNYPSSNTNGKSMVRGAVSNNNLALWWCQWPLQVQSTFAFGKILEVGVIYTKYVNLMSYGIFCHYGNFLSDTAYG